MKRYDVAVVGCGVAGVAAAAAAARMGAKTVIIEKTCTPGGLATAGLINIFLPLCDGNGTQVTFGLADELIRLSLKYGPGKIPPDWMHRKNAAEEERLRCVFSPAAMILALEELLMDSQVDIWYDTLVAGVEKSGKQIIIVSSGAGICGVGAINKWSRRKDMNYKQALCAIGQVELMMAYKEFFAKYDIHVAQILLTRDDFSNSERELHIRNTLFTLIDEGVVPVINENDSVSVEEIKIGDNDNLSALTGNLWNADALVILSDIDGVFDKDPKKHKDAKLITEVRDIDALMEKIETGGVGSFGTGGIVTKLEAAKRAGEYGIPTILLNGMKKDAIIEAEKDMREGTAFLWD